MGKRLVLLGGGHAHAQVIKAFRKPASFSCHLVTDRRDSFYSGMLPGCVARLYRPEELTLDVVRLCEWAGWECTVSAAVAIDAVPEEQRNVVKTLDGGRVAYDLLSVDVGSVTAGMDIPGVAEYALATRPISDLIARLEAAETALEGRRGTAAAEETVRVVVCGGGAAGVELAFALRARFAAARGDDAVAVVLVDSHAEFLAAMPKAMRDRAAARFEMWGMRTRLGSRVAAIEELPDGRRRVRTEDGGELDADLVVWATGAAAPPFLAAATPLAVDDAGFMRVDKQLRSVSARNVHGAGDCIAIDGLPKGHPPKAGVYAVREGGVLVRNLGRLLGVGEGDLEEYEPQGDFLKLLMTGDGRAIGSKFGTAFEGAWVWRMKDWIDRQWMDSFLVHEDGRMHNKPFTDRENELQNVSDVSAAEAAELLWGGDAARESFLRELAVLKRMGDEADFCAAVLKFAPQ